MTHHPFSRNDQGTLNTAARMARAEAEAVRETDPEEAARLSSAATTLELLAARGATEKP